MEAAKAAAPAPTRLMRLSSLLTVPPKLLIAWSREPTGYADSFGRTGGYRTVSHAAYDVVAHVDIAVFDSDVTIAVNGLNGKTIIIYCRIAGRYTIKIR